ncbi:Uncharacterised protein [Vibrio cholerae]|uniref:Uncharacterized protein n=1 Tax=Vibrio cholerae TaxID=666 RepID=A0A656AQV0_VIBCL|nr:Uncharacterised protein [Vibrio cholerae]CRZ93774.1 Uncharacterised protein [Vibrio cholerae]CSB85852.1 Uncharacterised protein [Vibrio cholerae]CSC06655.1 Uncharacterised protein [Vibrio cholerae]CSC12943.1 Uncharacterised protein [Vibrio cholerae]
MVPADQRFDTNNVVLLVDLRLVEKLELALIERFMQAFFNFKERLHLRLHFRLIEHELVTPTGFGAIQCGIRLT